MQSEAARGRYYNQLSAYHPRFLLAPLPRGQVCALRYSPASEVRAPGHRHSQLTDSDRLHIVGLLSLFVLGACMTFVRAVDMSVCGDRLREAHAAAWNASHPSIPPPPLEVTYQQCLVECGGGLGNVSWSVFSQSVITWFIPWVVLAFQIPFSAECESLAPDLRRQSLMY